MYCPVEVGVTNCVTGLEALISQVRLFPTMIFYFLSIE